MFTVRCARLAISMVLALSMLLTASIAPTAVAQDPAVLPGLGETILTDQLTTPGTFVAGNCASKRIDGEFAPHGFQLQVTGVCTEGDQSAGVALTTQGLSLHDGDLVVDVQVTEGYDRAVIGLHARRTQSEFGLFLSWAPALRRIAVRDRPTGPVTVAAEGQSVPDVAPGAWTQLALRVQGDRFWVLMNDQLVLTATHSATTRGGAGLFAGRFGNLQDDYPVTVLWRNMRVSALADGDPARTPVYAAPQRSQPTGAPAAGASRRGDDLAAVGAPSEPGAVVHEEAMTERGLAQQFTCASGKNRGEVTQDGYRLLVSGRCEDVRPSASLSALLNGLTMADGEIRFEFKVAAGAERVALMVLSRAPATGNGPFYLWRYAPGQGDLALAVFQPGTGFQTLALRNDLKGKLGLGEWHSIAIRQHGHRHWMLVDDQPVLASEDSSADAGAVVIALTRLGAVEDDAEVAVTVRNLRISRIEGAPDDRAPIIQRPSERPTRPGGNLSQLPNLLWSERLALFR